jgi:multidrug efflux pump subunit AcrA (membrane-fusion protein)
MKRLADAVIVIAIVATGWEIHRRIVASAGKGGPDRAAAPVAVEVEPVRKDTIRDIGVFTGSLVPQSQFVVAPKAAGWLKKLLVDIGDRVRRNDVIAVLDDEQFTRQVEQAGRSCRWPSERGEGASALDLARAVERITASARSRSPRLPN